MLASGKRAQHRCVNLTSQSRDERDCRSVELRALCNEVPRTPPGPEGSNGIGNASGAAVHPKFLAFWSCKFLVLSFYSEEKKPAAEYSAFPRPSLGFPRWFPQSHRH